jgi:hypothetical protein
MTLRAPNLDDRTFEQLLDECKRRIPALCPTWTDLSDGDPGIVLLQLFAYLTETMIYRLNRLPDKVFVELLNLLDVRLAPPHAAIATLRLSTEAPAQADIEIPRGVRAAVGRSGTAGDPIVFVTDRAVRIARGSTQVEVTAHHAEEIAAELVGRGTGRPGVSLRVQRPPVIAPTGDGLDFVLGVEMADGEDVRAPGIVHQGKRFRIWREVPAFVNVGADRHVYRLDRTQGVIQFAPAARMSGVDALDPSATALAEPPADGREIRVWYRRGGGASGNAAAGAIDTLKDPIPQVRVTNPGDATGGRDPESLENALVRGPQELRRRDRAVTADDFEALALQSGGVVRARALTRAQHWRYATPGTVEVLLVPEVPGANAAGFRITLERLLAVQSEPLRRDIEALLAARRPLGTYCVVNWARYKRVAVIARVVVYRQEDAAQVRNRVLDRLYRAFSPLPNSIRPNGWNFGETLRAFHVHDSAVAEPGVRFVDRVRFRVDEMPDADVSLLMIDPFQPATWYAASGGVLYRTLNDGDGWEPSGRFDGQVVTTGTPHRDRAGWLAVTTHAAGNPNDVRVHLSRDCGETWEERARLDSPVRSIAWIDRDDEPLLLLASEAGLFQLTASPGRGPALIELAHGTTLASPIAVAAATNLEGQVCVAVALSQRGGVWLSREAGRNETFQFIKLDNVPIRMLEIETQGSRTFLWAGTASGGGDEGTGCHRYELTGGDEPPEGWVQFKTGWVGGSCFDLAFAQGQAYAATHHGGVLKLDARATASAWKPVRLNAGLPLLRGDTADGPREREGLAPVEALAADPSTGIVLAGGPYGVFRSADAAESFAPASVKDSEQVTLPPTWLFCPGEHDITVMSEDEID